MKSSPNSSLRIEETMARYQKLEESVRQRIAEGTLGMAEGNAAIAEARSFMEQQKARFSSNSDDESGSEGEDA